MILALGEILRRNAAAPGLSQKTALIFGERTWTYADLNTYLRVTSLTASSALTSIVALIQ